MTTADTAALLDLALLAADTSPADNVATTTFHPHAERPSLTILHPDGTAATAVVSPLGGQIVFSHNLGARPSGVRTIKTSFYAPGDDGNRAKLAQWFATDHSGDHLDADFNTARR